MLGSKRTNIKPHRGNKHFSSSSGLNFTPSTCLPPADLAQSIHWGNGQHRRRLWLICSSSSLPILSSRFYFAPVWVLHRLQSLSGIFICSGMDPPQVSKNICSTMEHLLLLLLWPWCSLCCSSFFLFSPALSIQYFLCILRGNTPWLIVWVWPMVHLLLCPAQCSPWPCYQNLATNLNTPVKRDPPVCCPSLDTLEQFYIFFSYCGAQNCTQYSQYVE